jgi:hypothetical protein
VKKGIKIVLDGITYVGATTDESDIDIIDKESEEIYENIGSASSFKLSLANGDILVLGKAVQRAHFIFYTEKEFG